MAKRTFQKVREFLARQQMLDGASGVVLAVSGGADSVVLLDIFTRLKEQSPEMRLHTAHLNHKLRGIESDEDAEFVHQLAAQHQIPCAIESADVSAIAATTGKSIEEAARHARYQFLRRLAVENACNRIATGHTMSDQAETLLMRLTRGTGLGGLRGMRPVTPAHEFTESAESSRQKAESHRQATEGVNANNGGSAIQLIRPLLCVSREEVEVYAREQGLRFRTDVSNFSLDYTRNRIRHQVLKELESINPQIVERLAHTAELLADEEEALEIVTASLLDEAAQGDTQSSSYAAQMILRQPVGLQRRMIFRAIERSRRQYSLPRQKQIEASHVEAVLSLLGEDASGKRVQLPEGLEVWREFGNLRLALSTPATGEEILLDKNAAEVVFGDFVITIWRRQPVTALQEVMAKNRAGTDWLTVALDEAHLPAQLLIRNRRRGEKALVAGQRQAKKLKQLMIDRQIPASERQKWVIVSTPDGQYIWSPMLPPEKVFLPGKTTKLIAILKASKKKRPLFGKTHSRNYIAGQE